MSSSVERTERSNFNVPETGKKPSYHKMKRFVIPKKENTKKKLNSISTNSAEYLRDYLPIISKSLYNYSSFSNIKIEKFQLVMNDELQNEYTERKKELKFFGRSDRELQDGYAFHLCKSFVEVEELTSNRLKVNNCFQSVLGHPGMGVCLQKHFDAMSPELLVSRRNYHAILYKYIKGKVKTVAENHSFKNFQEPTPNCDIHLSKNSIAPGASLKSVYFSSQIYLFEYGDEGIEERPRHICPFAVIKFSCTAPPVWSVTQAKKISSTKVKIPGDLTYSSPINVWNGLLKAGTQHVASVGMFSSSFTVKPTRLGNAIEANKVINESEMSNYLGNLTRLSKKRQCPTNNHYLMYFELKCRSGSEKGHVRFKELTTYYKTHNKIGVVVCEDKVLLLLLPTCDLTKRLGLSTTSSDSNNAPVLHCIFVSQTEAAARFHYIRNKTSCYEGIDYFDCGFKNEMPHQNRLKKMATKACFEQQLHHWQTYEVSHGAQTRSSNDQLPSPNQSQAHCDPQHLGSVANHYPLPQDASSRLDNHPQNAHPLPKSHLICNELCNHAAKHPVEAPRVNSDPRISLPLETSLKDHLVCNEFCKCATKDFELNQATFSSIDEIVDGIKDVHAVGDCYLSQKISELLLTLLTRENNKLIIKILSSKLNLLMTVETMFEIITSSVGFHFRNTHYLKSFYAEISKLTSFAGKRTNKADETSSQTNHEPVLSNINFDVNSMLSAMAKPEVVHLVKTAFDTATQLKQGGMVSSNDGLPTNSNFFVQHNAVTPEDVRESLDADYSDHSGKRKTESEQHAFQVENSPHQPKKFKSLEDSLSEFFKSKTINFGSSQSVDASQVFKEALLSEKRKSDMMETELSSFSDSDSEQDDDEDDESYLDTVMNFNNLKDQEAIQTLSIEYKLTRIDLIQPERKMKNQPIKTILHSSPIIIPVECLAQRLHDPRLELAPEVEELEADGTVTSTTSNFSAAGQQIKKENASEIVDRSIQDIINEAVDTFHFKSQNVLLKNNSPTETNTKSSTLFNRENIDQNFDCSMPSTSSINNLSLSEGNFSISESVMNEIKKISSALSQDQNATRKYDVSERLSPNANLVTSTHEGFECPSSTSLKSNEDEINSSMQMSNRSDGKMYPASQESLGFDVPSVESVDNSSGTHGCINTTVQDMIMKFSVKTKDVLTKAGISHEFVKDFDKSLQLYKDDQLNEERHLPPLSKYIETPSSHNNKFERVINAATDQFLCELAKRKRENYFFVFNNGRPICLTLEKHLSFFLDKKQLDAYQHRNDYNFPHDVCIYLHKEDIHHVKDLPCLFWFKNIPFSSFYVFDDIKKVDTSHDGLQKIFPESGVIVSDSSYFDTIASGQLDKLLKGMLDSKSEGKSNWILLLHSNILLNLSSSKKDNKLDRSDILKTFISYSEHNIWQVMPSHECDNPGSTFVNQLNCATDIQDSHVNSHKHVIILSDDFKNTTKLQSCGIGMMNIEDTIRFLHHH